MKNKYVFRVALSGILCAEAVALSFFEGLIPSLPFLPPGAKPGFSNIITMFAAACIGPGQALTVAAVKSAFVFVTRGTTAAAMSLSGGILSTVIMYLLIRYGRRIFGIIGISVTGALFHNIGQLITSVIITGSLKTLYYAPALIVFAVITGIITGVIFRTVYPALEKQKNYFSKL